MLSCTLRKAEQTGNLHERLPRGATSMVQRRLDCVADGLWGLWGREPWQSPAVLKRKFRLS